MATLAEKEARRPAAWRMWREVLGNPRYFVAPMVDVSVLPFRLLCKRHGADICYTQMFHSGIFSREEGWRRKIFATCEEDRPLVVQLAGNDPDVMVEAAQFVQGHCAAVDVNLGCPQKIAKKGMYGAFIACNRPVVRKIVEAMSSKLESPVLCKMRIQETTEQTVAFARMLEEAGCQALCVHGRTRSQVSLIDSRADWNAIARVVEAVSIPVIANGDIKTRDDVDRCLAITGAQAVMAGSGAMANPALFSKESIPHWQLAEEFVDLCVHFETPVPAVRGILVKMTVESVSRYADLREALVTTESIEEVRSIVADMKFRTLAGLPPVLQDDARPAWAWSAPSGEVEVDLRPHGDGWTAWHDITVTARVPLVCDGGAQRPGDRWVQFSGIGSRIIPIATLRKLRDAVTWTSWDCRHSVLYINVKEPAVYDQLVQQHRVTLFYKSDIASVKNEEQAGTACPTVGNSN